MAKIRNMRIYGTPEQIKAAKEESDFIGRNISRIEEPGTLVIYAIPPKKKSKPKVEDEKAEKKERQPRRGNGFNRYKDMD